MLNMEVMDWLLLGCGALIAVNTLVRLMRRRRDEVLAELTAQAQVERERQRQADAREKKRQRKQRAA